MRASKHLVCCLGLAALCSGLLSPTVAQAGFGIESFSATARNKGGTVDLQAGSHPYEYTVSLVMNHAGEQPEGTLRDLIVDLPPGMAGNPLAVPRCSGGDFEGFVPNCPLNTQIGIAHIDLPGLPNFTSAVYNLTPPLGIAASVGLSINNINSFQEASLRASDYGLRVSDITVPTNIPVLAVRETIWGVPADPGHDAEREPCIQFSGGGGCPSPSDVFPVPFLTLPTACTGPLKTILSVDSLQEPGVFQQATFKSLGEGAVPEGLSGCGKPRFEPTIAAQPETGAGDSPTGIHFNLHLPQNEALSPDPEEGGALKGIATAQLKNTVVTLPAGMAVNPSSADGLGACALQGPEGINLPGSGEPGESEAAKCPANSRVGTVEVETPALDHTVSGNVYIARPDENPFGSLVALYVAVDDPISGVVVKLAGKVEPDPVTGQLKATFKDNPQLPFEDFSFDFSGGPRATLTTPPTCGNYSTIADLTPWTSPEAPDVALASSFSITTAPGGGACAQTEAQMPNKPSFEAGTAEPLAGAFSPFLMKLNRENGSQRIAALRMTLPAGVSAKLAGVAECSEAQIAQAQARNGLGEGALEQASPSCPQASKLGVVSAGAGSGNPFFVSGSVYLAGRYKGAPLSLVIITPGVAGPFDLGTVVVRAPLYVNETTAQGTVRSDPLPTILQGIPLDLRTVAVKIDRPNFTLNPTSCEEKAVGGEEISTVGQVVTLSRPFQVEGCRGLNFSPKLSLSMTGGTKRSGHPAFKAVLTQPSGQANIARTAVILPPTEFIDQNHISNPCTRAQFAEHMCPPSSVLGTARAFTPLLDKPLEGPVYFRSNGGERELPDVVADLNGQVHLVLVGFVDSVHKKGSESSRVRTTFATVPDAPVSKFVLQLKGGKKGLLVNSANICKVANTASVKMTAQNNKAEDLNLPIKTSCGSK